MKRSELDLRVYLVTDRGYIGDRSLETVVAQAVKGGVTVVQLREKECSTREFVDLARRLKAILTPLKVPLIINDRLDVAQAIGADGVHLGQKDMSYEEARRILSRKPIIGLSVESMGDAEEAAEWDVDYLGVSPIFATPTKTDTGRPWGFDGLRELRAFTTQTLVAIGGINAENAAQVVKAGADGVAVVSAICASDDPEGAARSIEAAVERGLAGRKHGLAGRKNRETPDKTEDAESTGGPTGSLP